MVSFSVDEPIENVPAPLGLYSHVKVTQSGSGLVWIAGQLAVDKGGQQIGIGDFRLQLRQVFENLGAVLTAARSSFAEVVKFTTYLVREEDIPTFYDERENIFRRLYPERGYPTNTLLVVKALTGPQFLVEVEAVATTKAMSVIATGGIDENIVSKTHRERNS